MEEPYKTPGQLIEALLIQRGWTNRVLAHVIDTDESGVQRIVSDKRSMDGELALILGEVFSVPPERLMDLQKSYELAKARIKSRPDPTRATRATVFGSLPVGEMIRRGWIRAKDIRDEAVEPELVRFFGSNRVDDIEALPHAAKKTIVNVEATPLQLAWLYRVRQIAKELLVSKYTQQSGESVIPKLKQLLLSAEEVRKVPRILAEAGIKFLIVESLPSAKIDGVCFWLNDRSPVIAMTTRFDRIDNFWFVLRHELEHVLQGHGKNRTMLDADLDSSGGIGPVEDEERIANEAASDFCVSQKMMKQFVDRKSPFFHDRDILAFSKMIGVHPGLIAGQIRRFMNEYHRFGNYLVKVRSSVLPNAAVDGWGNVYPVE
jgi:HTH-type transcriptional regulator / antitoxin HigA